MASTLTALENLYVFTGEELVAVDLVPRLNENFALLKTTFDDAIQDIKDSILKVTYVTFSSSSGWTSSNGQYYREICTDDKKVLNIQVSDDDNYYVTNLIDLRISDGKVLLYSLFPFTGRAAIEILSYSDADITSTMITDVVENNGTVSVYRGGIVEKSFNIVKSVEGVAPDNGNVTLIKLDS